MLDLSEFQRSTLYQSILKKTKLDIVPKLLKLDVEEVRKVARG